VLSVFIAYQMHRYVYTHDLGLIVLTVLDLAVMGLAWSEYRLRRTQPIAGTGIAASR
jgi:uncharacterized membrane protein